jgi:hypothetical protein
MGYCPFLKCGSTGLRDGCNGFKHQPRAQFTYKLLPAGFSKKAYDYKAFFDLPQPPDWVSLVKRDTITPHALQKINGFGRPKI